MNQYYYNLFLSSIVKVTLNAITDLLRKVNILILMTSLLFINYLRETVTYKSLAKKIRDKNEHRKMNLILIKSLS